MEASKDHVEELVTEDYQIPQNPVHHAKVCNLLHFEKKKP